MVDATIIDAPSSTKNRSKARDPEMSSTKKGNDWYFGPPLVVCRQTTAGQRKAHIGVDVDSGTVHSSALQTIHWIVCVTLELRKAPKGGKLDPINRIIAMVRAKVEHPFRVLKRQFGHVKTRYRGLAKNRAQLFTMFALSNLFLVRRRLLV